MTKHTQTICRQQPTNCLSVFDHFVGLELKRLIYFSIDILSQLRTLFILLSYLPPVLFNYENALYC